jgi:hypothetical protein
MTTTAWVRTTRPRSRWHCDVRCQSSGDLNEMTAKLEPAVGLVPASAVDDHRDDAGDGFSGRTLRDRAHRVRSGGAAP